jgi:hypothetical protein
MYYLFPPVGWTTGVLLPAGTRDFSLLHSVETGSGAHPASYPMSNGVLPPGVKRRGYEADLHPVPRSGIVELYLYSTICILGIELNCIVKYRDKITFTCHLRSDNN